MKLFLKRIIYFFIGLPFIIITSYILLDYYYNSINSDDALFIWGDSQTYRGIDMTVLQQQTNRKVYTAAKHGAGVYDFLVFSKKVPSNSDVLIALSKPVQLRRKQRDNNRSGLSLSALRLLRDNNYLWPEINSIFLENIRPTRLFLTETTMFPYSDSIVVSEPISVFKEIYNEIPDYLEYKQRLLLKGIEILMDKDCNISFIEFPYHPTLQGIENQSDVKLNTEQFKKMVIDEFQPILVDTISLDIELQVMYDLTHLNETGASNVSKRLAELFQKKESRTLYIVQWRESLFHSF